jgi:hypothetical protein
MFNIVNSARTALFQIATAANKNGQQDIHTCWPVLIRNVGRTKIWDASRDGDACTGNHYNPFAALDHLCHLANIALRAAVFVGVDGPPWGKGWHRWVWAPIAHVFLRHGSERLVGVGQFKIILMN